MFTLTAVITTSIIGFVTGLACMWFLVKRGVINIK